MLPTNQAEHETLEITQGSNDWVEVDQRSPTAIFSGAGHDFAPERGFNFGVGVGTAGCTDLVIVKCILV